MGLAKHRNGKYIRWANLLKFIYSYSGQFVLLVTVKTIHVFNKRIGLI